MNFNRDSYIVRIYRREPEHRKLVGMVEIVGVEEKKPFRNAEELWGILNEAGKERKSKKMP